MERAPIRDLSGFIVFKRALKQLKLKKIYELIVLSTDQHNENMEFHLQWENDVQQPDDQLHLNVKEYISHDQQPYEYSESYIDILKEYKLYHFKVIKMINRSNDKSVMLYKESKNPKQLKMLELGDEGFFALKYIPLTSASYPGECVICSDNIYAGGYCRVNCQAGHVFHCECINQWRNTRQVNPYFERDDWQDNCPICRGAIDKIVKIKMPKRLLPLKPEFGKKHRYFKKSELKVINMEIKYLRKNNVF